MAKAADRWHRWLMDGRFGGDPAARDRLLTELLYPVRDTVLDKARLRPGDTVLDVGTGDGLIARLEAFYESIQPPGADPMLDFDERDLVRQAERAGFADIGLERRVTVKNGKRPVPWDRALRMSGNPLIPPLGEVLGRVLGPQEIAEFTAHVKPLVESGTGRERQALAYLAATKD